VPLSGTAMTAGADAQRPGRGVEFLIAEGARFGLPSVEGCAEQVIAKAIGGSRG